MTNQPCLFKIKSRLKVLTDAESKVANYVIDNYADILKLTVMELAEKSQSSDATVVRFCKSVGYKGYQEFKISLAQDMILPAKHLNPELDQDDSTEVITKKIFDSVFSVLQETLTVVDIDEIEKAAQAISTAGKVVILGCGGSSYVGMDAMHKFLKIGIECFIYSDVDTQAMAASLMKKGDVVIGISHSGCNKSVIDCLKLAKQAGALIIGLTTQGKSPMLKNCDIVLCTSTKETVFKSESVTARIAQLVIIDSLVASVAFKNYGQCYDAIQKTRNATASRKF